MTTGIKDSPAPSAKRRTVISLPPDLAALLEETDRYARERYGQGPGIELLAHICIAGMTPGILLLAYEESVLDIHRGSLRPNKEGIVDEDCL